MGIDFNNGAVRVFSGVSLVVFFLLSYRVTREDLAAQKIPNTLILKYLKICAAMYAALFSYGIVKNDIFAMNYTYTALLNASFSLAFGYALWYFDVFSPGDAKYFFLTALLVPLQAYTRQFVPYFPSLVVLINAYVIAFIMMFAFTLYLMARRTAGAASRGYFSRENMLIVGKQALGNAVNLKFWTRLAGMLLYMISIILVMRMAAESIRGFVRFSSGSFTLLTFIVLYFASNRVQALMRKSKTIAWIAYFLFANVMLFQQLVLHKNVFDAIAQSVAASFLMMIVFPFARLIIETYHEALNTVQVKTVRMGTVLTEDTVELFKVKWGVCAPALVPLTDAQSQAVKDNVPNMEHIRVVKHITFGPFVFIGALFTILFGHTVIHYL